MIARLICLSDGIPLVYGIAASLHSSQRRRPAASKANAVKRSPADSTCRHREPVRAWRSPYVFRVSKDCRVAAAPRNDGDTLRHREGAPVAVSCLQCPTFIRLPRPPMASSQRREGKTKTCPIMTDIVKYGQNLLLVIAESF